MIQPGSPILAPQRRELIRSLVRDEGIVRVEDLRLNLKVSVATIRRDLEILEENGKLQRVHGGAVTMENLTRLIRNQILDVSLVRIRRGQASPEAKPHRPHKRLVDMDLAKHPRGKGAHHGLADLSEFSANQENFRAGVRQLGSGLQRIGDKSQIRPVLEQAGQTQSRTASIQVNRITRAD